jgi:CubicO group peptidase (beta-lactamase class C family)
MLPKRSYTLIPDVTNKQKMKITFYTMLMILTCTNAIGQKWNTQIDNFLSDELPKFNIPNLEVLVVDKDSILYSKSIGQSSPSSTYYIGSVSKSLTAYGILKLIEQKKLSFDSRVVDNSA